jgi:hypothetical protein
MSTYDPKAAKTRPVAFTTLAGSFPNLILMAIRVFETPAQELNLSQRRKVNCSNLRNPGARDVFFTHEPGHERGKKDGSGPIRASPRPKFQRVNR